MPYPAPNVPHLLPLLFALALPSAQGASFDCAKAGTWLEQALCQNETLGRLDEHLASAYRAARESAQGDLTALEQLKTVQRQWLRERDNCKSVDCISRLYERRIEELAPASQRRGTEHQIGSLGQQRVQETLPHVGIEAVYPVLHGDGPVVKTANGEIRALVETLVHTFRGQASEYAAGPGPAGGDWEGPDWSLTIDYDHPHQTHRYLAIPFSGYEYTGGAHGMPLILPLVIELSSGQRVPPEGLFVPGSNWLERLSQRCLAELQGRDLLGADDQWLREGTAPKLENYGLLFPGPDGLRVSFAPYAVAPYAAGIQEVLIPYPELAGLLDPRLFGP